MKPRRTKSLAGIIIGVVLMVGAPIVGLFLTTSGMHQSFGALGNDGIGNPDQLSRGIGLVLRANLITLAGGIGGFLILAVSTFCFVMAGGSSGSRQEAAEQS